MKSFPPCDTLEYARMMRAFSAVAARTVGFDNAFGTDEQIEFNNQRGVFHILRQNGCEITDEWPTDALIQCEWTENTELTALGSMVSGGISLLKSAAKAAGSQTAVETEERLSSAGVVRTLRGESDVLTQNVWFGIFPMGMSRSNKKKKRTFLIKPVRSNPKL